MKRIAIGVLLAGAFGVSAQETVSRPRTVADFFRDFTAEWIRSSPSQAASTRYFSGAEQEQFEQQLSPETAEFRHARAALAQKVLTELATFDPARMNETERVSADLMKWQLGAV